MEFSTINNKKATKNAANKAYREANVDKLKATQKAYYEANVDTIQAKMKAYRAANVDKAKAYRAANLDKAKAYRAANLDKIKATKKAYYAANVDKKKAYNKAYHEANVDKAKAYCEANVDKIKVVKKAYRAANRDKIKATHKAYYAANVDKLNAHNNNRRKTDIQYKLSTSLRSRLYRALHINSKTGSAVKDLGCSIDELRLYLESKFQSGMSWDNWTTDGWHIDHIKPLASFDLTDRQQLLLACHYTNLQPLWAIDNLAKSDSIINA